MSASGLKIFSEQCVQDPANALAQLPVSSAHWSWVQALTLVFFMQQLDCTALPVSCAELDPLPPMPNPPHSMSFLLWSSSPIVDPLMQDHPNSLGLISLALF